MGDEFLREWQAWRERREAGLRAPHGFLSITAMHWLGPEPQRYDGVPGAWSSGPDGVEVTLGDGEDLSLDGVPLSGRHGFGQVDEEGVRATYGDVELEIARRGKDVILRPRDPASPLRTTYGGTPTFPPSPEWVVTATFHPLDGPAPDEDAVGEVEFTLQGEPVRLVAFDDDGGLWLVFSDATSGGTTYGAGRQLSAPQPAADGTVVLDFNRTANLPCAYTDLTTCPVPLPQNRLTVAIEAGERDPGLG